MTTLLTPEFTDWLHKRARAAVFSRNWFGTEADDLAQSVLLKLHDYTQRDNFEYQGDNQFRALALRIMKQLAINANKYAADHAMTSIDGISGDDDQTFEVADTRANPVRDAQFAALYASIDKLSNERQRNVMTLLAKGYKVKEAAEELGIAQNTATKAKLAAIARLREIMTSPTA